MQYDGNGKLAPAIASLFKFSPKNQTRIAKLIKEAKKALGITSNSKNLPVDVKLAIYQWHYERLNPVYDVKQADGGTLDLSLNDTVQDIKQDVSVQDKLIIQALPDTIVQDVKQANPVQIEGADSSVYDFKQLHFAISLKQNGQAKRTTVMLEGYLVKALQRKHDLSDNAAIRSWIEQAIKTDGGKFDCFAPLTKQVKRMIIESMV